MKLSSDKENKINLLYEDEHLIFIEKPYACEFHGDLGCLSLLRKNRPEALGVHRLDRDTSGVMVFAKSKEVQRELSALFENRQVEKSYLAIGTQKPKKKQGLIKGDIIKARGGNYRLARTLNNPSITLFKTFSMGEGYRCFYLNPRTGKTHQLRVVMKSLGSPILGDPRYGGDNSDRMYLHAFRLKIPWRDQVIDILNWPSQGDLFCTHRQMIEEMYDQLV